MPSTNQQRRSCLSCDLCRSRKTKCLRSANEACQRCVASGKHCRTTNPKPRRPYYQTSREQFELMTAIVHHFLPGVPLEVDALRKAVNGLQNTPEASDEASTTRRRHGFGEAPVSSVSSIAAVAASPPVELSRPISQTLLPLLSPEDEQTAAAAVAYSPRAQEEDDHDLYSDSMDVPRFDAGSGWNVFYANIRATFAHSRARLLQCQPPVSDTPRDGQPVEKAHPQDLPDRAAMDKAIIVFFTEVNVGTYVLDHDEFLVLLDSAYRHQLPLNNADIMIIHLVYALCGGSEDSFAAADRYFTKTLTEGTLESVQALALLVLCLIVRFQRELAWAVLGSANRIAQSLGLHCSAAWDMSSAQDQEKRDTIWWSLYSLEAFLSGVLGRDIAFQADLYDATPPGQTMLKVCYGIPPGYAAFSTSLIRIYGQIMGLVYRQALTKRIDIPSTHVLLDRLKEWKRNLPGYLQPGCPTAPSYTRAINYLSLRYHHMMMLLTRHYLLRPLVDNRPDSWEWAGLVKICEDANDESISLLQEAFRENFISKTNYLDAYYIIADCMILFLRILKRPTEHGDKLGRVIPLVALTEHIHFGRFELQSLSALQAELENIRDRHDNPHLHAEQSLRRINVYDSASSSGLPQALDDLSTATIPGLDALFEDFWNTAELVGWDPSYESAEQIPY